MNILLEGIFYNGHGFAEGNRILLRILHEAGYRVRILARDSSQKHLVLPAEEVRFISSFADVELDSPDIYICNYVGSEAHPNPRFRINIARTTFETDRIPEAWVPELNRFDEVWVQCEFNRRTFEASGVKTPLRLIPNFFDTAGYEPSGPVLTLPVNAAFLFLSIFDMQKRKGYDILIDAFLQEFTRDDDVALILKIRDDRDIDAVEDIVEAHPKPAALRPPVYVIHHMLPVEELQALYRLCDAFVLPSRGEGWGRPFFEAMLMELPVIGTDWSGQKEFMNEANSYLVRNDKLALVTESEFQPFIGHYWAEPSPQDLREKMRFVLVNREEAAETGRRARQDLLSRFTLEQTAAKVVAEIEKYRGVLRPPTE